MDLGLTLEFAFLLAVGFILFSQLMLYKQGQSEIVSWLEKIARGIEKLHRRLDKFEREG